MASPAPELDSRLPPTTVWRQFVPAWLRPLIWTDGARNYDAFLSYSWAADKKVAPVIQSAIHRFLCPWYKLRAKSIFRDLSSLPAGSSLEGELFDRLDRSTHLLVLASPEAAHSHGMEIEAQHWFSRTRQGQVLILITGGDCQVWSEIKERLLPPVFRNSLSDEPLWIPLAHLREGILENPADHQLKAKLIEDMKQVLLRFYPGQDWGELRGEERSQRRRAIGFLAAAACVFLILAVIASFSAWYAETQRRVAVEQRRVAVEQARSATSHTMALESGAVRASDPGLGLLLAAAADDLQDNAQARGSLLMSLDAVPALASAEIGGIDHASALAASPRQNLLAIGDTSGITHLCEVVFVSCKHSFTTPSGKTVTALAFDPQGRTLAIGNAAGEVAVWDWSSGNSRALNLGHVGRIELLSLSGDGLKLAAAGLDGDRWVVGIWPLDGSAAPLKIQKPHGSWLQIEHLALLPDGTLVIVEWGDIFKVTSSGQVKSDSSLPKYPRPGPSAYLSDGSFGVRSGLETGYLELLAPLASGDGGVEPTGRRTAPPSGDIQLDQGFIDEISFNADGSRLAAAQAGALSVFDRQGRRLRKFTGLEGETKAIVFSPDSGSVATLGNERVQLWRLQQLAPLKRFAVSGVGVPSVIEGVVSGSFSPDEKEVAWVAPPQADSPFEIAVWNSDTNRVTRHRAGVSDDDAPLSLFFAANGRLTFLDDQSTVLTLDLSTGVTSELDCGGITPGPEWQAAAEGSSTFRRCLANRIETADLSASSKKGLPSNEKPVVSALSNSGARLVVVTDAGSIMLLDRPSELMKMRRLADLGRGKETRMVRPSSLRISPDGRLVAFYNGGTTSEVFNLDDLLADLPPTGIRTANVGIVDRLAFSNNGEWLATIRSDGTISLWDAAGLIEVGTLKGTPAGWHDLVFSPSGALLGEFGSGGIMTLWDMAPQSWKQKACTLSGRTLSQLERTRYLPGGEFSFPINPCVSTGGKL